MLKALIVYGMSRKGVTRASVDGSSSGSAIGPDSYISQKICCNLAFNLTLLANFHYKYVEKQNRFIWIWKWITWHNGANLILVVNVNWNLNLSNAIHDKRHIYRSLLAELLFPSVIGYGGLNIKYFKPQLLKKSLTQICTQSDYYS